METRPLALAYLILLALMLGGSFLTLSTVTVVTVEVRYLPWWIDLEEPPTWGFYAFITPPNPYSASDINPETILLEGTLAPTYARSWWFLFFAKFDPDAVVGIIWAKIFHIGMPPGKVTIYLKITGAFFDGTPFEGEGRIRVKIPEPLT